MEDLSSQSPAVAILSLSLAALIPVPPSKLLLLLRRGAWSRSARRSEVAECFGNPHGRVFPVVGLVLTDGRPPGDDAKENWGPAEKNHRHRATSSTNPLVGPHPAAFRPRHPDSPHATCPVLRALALPPALPAKTWGDPDNFPAQALTRSYGLPIPNCSSSRVISEMTCSGACAEAKLDQPTNQQVTSSRPGRLAVHRSPAGPTFGRGPGTAAAAPA